MSKSESLKEEISSLKTLCGFLLAGEASLIAWFVQNYASRNHAFLLSAAIAAVTLAQLILAIIRRIYRCIKTLEHL
jgi:hypothetical protein